MPITDTLQNSKRLEALGFDHEKSQGISEILEDAIQAGQQDLKEFIRAELQGVKIELQSELNDVKGKLNVVKNELRAEFHMGMRDQLLKFVAIMAMMISLAVAIIKLFPGP